MKKQMKRTVYEAPVTERFSVELEGAFMTASADLTNGNANIAGINDQEVNTEFTMDFSNDEIGKGTNVWD